MRLVDPMRLVSRPWTYRFSLPPPPLTPGGGAKKRTASSRAVAWGERTHNARRYATLPGGGPDVVRPDIPARPRAAWRCVVRITHHVRCTHKPQSAQRHA